MPGNHPVRVVIEVIERVARQLGELWEYVEKVYSDEEQQPNETDYVKEISRQAVSETIREINEALKDKEISRQVKQKLNYTKKNCRESLRNMRKEKDS